MKPRMTARLIEAAEMPIRAEEALLNHVFGILFVAGHSEYQPEGIPAVPLHERAKRVVVALAGSGQDGRCFARSHLTSLRRPGGMTG
jgi:hypothetical protein